MALDRIRVLDMMVNGVCGDCVGNRDQHTCDCTQDLTKEASRRSVLRGAAGSRIAQRELIERLLAAGYYSDGPVELPGTFTRRGGIIDIYPPTEDRPVRLDFFGMRLRVCEASIRVHRASIQTLDRVRIGPARESLYDGESGVGWMRLRRR